MDWKTIIALVRAGILLVFALISAWLLGVMLGRLCDILPTMASGRYRPVPIAMAAEPKAIVIESMVEPTEPETEAETTSAAIKEDMPTEPEVDYSDGPGAFAVPETEPPTPKYETYISDEERVMIAKMVHAEATGEPFMGKQLVVDVILNRVASSRFPNSVHEVLTQRGQFQPMRNGAYNRAEPDDEDYVAVDTELYGKVDYGVLYFNAGRRAVNGKGAWKYGGHWFAY